MRDFHQACHVLDDMNRATPRSRYMTCIKAICEAHRVPMRLVMGYDKTRPIADARRDCYYELNRQFGLNATQIGRVMNKDRTSVTCSWRKYGDPRVITDPTSPWIRPQERVE